VAFSGFMQFVIRASDAPLAVVVCAQWGGTGEEKCGAQS
jgi:hypothetical protein